MKLNKNFLALAVLVAIFIADNCFAVNNNNETVSKKQWFDAVESGDIATMERAVTQRFDINQRDRRKQTALGMAIKKKKVEVVKFLLDHNVRLNDVDSDNLSAFSCFMTYGVSCHEIASHLCAKGVNFEELNDTDNNGRTLLFDMFSSEEECVKTLEILLANDHDRVINLNIVDVVGFSLLHRAALSGHHNIVKLLIQHGANVQIFSQKGETPLFLTTFASLEDGSLTYGGLKFMMPGENKLNTEKVSNMQKVLQHYIRKGVDINHKNQFGQTAAMWAIQSCARALRDKSDTATGWYYVALFLIKTKKYNVWLTDNNQCSILKYASQLQGDYPKKMKAEIFWKMRSPFLTIIENRSISAQQTTGKQQKSQAALTKVCEVSDLVRFIGNFI